MEMKKNLMEDSLWKMEYCDGMRRAEYILKDYQGKS